jgi:methyl-accepting chemotaxis protein
LERIEQDEAAIKVYLKTQADQVGKLFDEAVKSGRVRMEDLFDRDYKPIAKTNPIQVTTKALSFYEQVLPAILESALAVDPKVVFCAAVDLNGYLPVHNKKFSLPQRDDPQWNAANCRNRRIFDDRTGLAAARNSKEFLVQTYPRELGGGTSILMKDVSTPIMVGGKQWGALRMGMTL